MRKVYADEGAPRTATECAHMRQSAAHGVPHSQGAQPSFSAASVPLLNYSAVLSGGLMAIAGKPTNFALRFSGVTFSRLTAVSVVRAPACAMIALMTMGDAWFRLTFRAPRCRTTERPRKSVSSDITPHCAPNRLHHSPVGADNHLLSRL